MFVQVWVTKVCDNTPECSRYSVGVMENGLFLEELGLEMDDWMSI